ncbi:hypothetical protein EV689_11160 [Avibacterium gallinarum]|uniref:Lipoprotein n=1 Tax=Avibacterium gallinarum TaxID=755 RepID=A0A379AYW6_AVIGA|nr:hypothetical protein EV689_11160 [Avibacterium gallinarum]SUB27813.1 Uncharacterised protein [Avibacterium gallinarum]
MMNILRNILTLLSCILLISCTSMLSKKNEEYDFNKGKCLNYSRHIEMNYQNGTIKFSDPVLQEIRYNECMRK